MVTISKERYEELVRAETVRDVLVGIVADENTDYRTAEMVRIFLKPYMPPKPLVEDGVPCAE